MALCMKLRTLDSALIHLSAVVLESKVIPHVTNQCVIQCVVQHKRINNICRVTGTSEERGHNLTTLIRDDLRDFPVISFL